MTRIEQIRQREQQATKGPWEARQTSDGRCDGINAVHSHGPDVYCGDVVCPGAEEIVTTDSGVYGPKWPDAEFIAHAREDIPHLLTLWDTRDAALRALVARWRKQAETADAVAADLMHEDGRSRKRTQAYYLNACADALDAILTETPQ